jgi:hypothetical protein
MPVAGGPNITKTGILLEVDSADKQSYPGSGTTWTNQVPTGLGNGTLNNISFDSTDSKGALIFTGSNTFVDFGNIGNLSSAWSFQVAFKPAPTSSGDAYTILSYASGSDTGSLTFKLDYSSSTQEVILSTFSTASATAKTVHAISASVASGSWSIVHGTFGSSLAALYVNGLGQAYQPTTGSLVGYNTSNQLYAGASYGLYSGFYTGSMANVTVNNADLDGLTVNKNYNAIATRFSLPIRRSVITDADAFNFVEAAGIINETQQSAINTLVLALKANDIWNQMVAVYPFVGGSASTHKFNLKDPRDINAAFRITFAGGWDHTSEGLIPNGLNTVADTQIIANTHIPNARLSSHFSIYTSQNEIGERSNGTRQISSVEGRFGAINIQISNQTRGAIGADILYSNGGITRGFLLGNRESLNLFNMYLDGVLKGTSTATPTTNISSQTFPIGAGKNSGFLENFMTTPISFASLGSGLTSSQVQAYYELVQAYQTTLGRQV